MKSSIKTIQNVGGLHDVRSYTGSVRKSGKPTLPTTTLLDLCSRRNEKDRLEKELKILEKKKIQLQRKLKDVEKELIKLVEEAAKTAMEIGGISVKGEKNNPVGGLEKKGKTVLEY